MRYRGETPEFDEEWEAPTRIGRVWRPVGEIIYLASPYTTSQISVQAHWLSEATAVTTLMAASGYCVLSPVLYTQSFKDWLPSTFDWYRFTQVLAERSDGIIVCCMDGWEDSVGVQEEIKLAESNGTPIWYLGTTRTDGDIAGQVAIRKDEQNRPKWETPIIKTADWAAGKLIWDEVKDR